MLWLCRHTNVCREPLTKHRLRRAINQAGLGVHYAGSGGRGNLVVEDVDFYEGLHRADVVWESCQFVLERRQYLELRQPTARQRSAVAKGSTGYENRWRPPRHTGRFRPTAPEPPANWQGREWRAEMHSLAEPSWQGRELVFRHIEVLKLYHPSDLLGQRRQLVLRQVQLHHRPQRQH